MISSTTLTDKINQLNNIVGSNRYVLSTCNGCHKLIDSVQGVDALGSGCVSCAEMGQLLDAALGIASRHCGMDTTSR